MTEISVPVFANDHGDLSVFDSLASMAADVEAIDVENGVYEFFDAAGHRLAADTRTGKVEFQIDPEKPADPHRLIEILRHYLQALPERFADIITRARETSSLEHLVSLCQEVERVPRPGMLQWLRPRRR